MSDPILVPMMAMNTSAVPHSLIHRIVLSRFMVSRPRAWPGQRGLEDRRASQDPQLT